MKNQNITHLSLLTDRLSQIVFSLLVVIWGFTWIMGKFQVHSGILPEVALLYRFLGTCVLTFLIIKFKKISLKVKKSDLKTLLIFAFFCTSLNFIFFYYAAYYMLTSISAVIYSFLIILSALIKHFFKIGSEKLIPILVSALIGIAGLFLIMMQKFYYQKIDFNLMVGIVFAFTATCFYAIGSVFYEANKITESVHPLASFFYTSILGCIIIIIEIVAHYIFSGNEIKLIPHITHSFIFSYIYLVISGFGIFFMMILIQRIGIIQTSYVNLITPVIAIFVSSVFEDYKIGISTLLGITLIIISNYIALFRKKIKLFSNL